MSRLSASPASPAPQGRTGRPPVTSRAEILVAARRIIDEDGWEKLTIRRLAAEAGIGATTLYHHIRNKDDLVVLLLNHHVGQIERPELPGEPRERIVTAATALRDALAAWPWAAEVLSADGFVGLLDESAMWMVEAVVAGAEGSGCTVEQSIDVFRNIWFYTVGEVLVRARSARRQAAGEPFAYRDDLDTSQVPHLAAIGTRWGPQVARDIYPVGLRAFVDALLAEAASANRSGTG
ncbi:TetR/AcrR family transcriptional regulator [Streptomyces sp. NPDC048442]|uniref:TetR/AcrR family transcriptional regulator n=1 Tax=Streptomyces sp. NPDC048442 TaxID=3154823 RepID=UPI003425E330